MFGFFSGQNEIETKGKRKGETWCLSIRIEIHGKSFIVRIYDEDAQVTLFVKIFFMKNCYYSKEFDTAQFGWKTNVNDYLKLTLHNLRCIQTFIHFSIFRHFWYPAANKLLKYLKGFMRKISHISYSAKCGKVFVCFYSVFLLNMREIIRVCLVRCPLDIHIHSLGTETHKKTKFIQNDLNFTQKFPFYSIV